MKRWTKRELREIIKPYKEHFGVEVWDDIKGYYELYMWVYDEKDEDKGKWIEDNQSIYPNGSWEHSLGQLTKEQLIKELENWKRAT